MALAIGPGQSDRRTAQSSSSIKHRATDTRSRPHWSQLKRKAFWSVPVHRCAALDRAVRMSVEHVSTRLQFGRPLAKFQAIRISSLKRRDQTSAAFITEAALNVAIETDWKSPYPGLPDSGGRSCAGHAASVVTRNSHKVRRDRRDTRAPATRIHPRGAGPGGRSSVPCISGMGRSPRRPWPRKPERLCGD